MSKVRSVFGGKANIHGTQFFLSDETVERVSWGWQELRKRPASSKGCLASEQRNADCRDLRINACVSQYNILCSCESTTDQFAPECHDISNTLLPGNVLPHTTQSNHNVNSALECACQMPITFERFLEPMSEQKQVPYRTILTGSKLISRCMMLISAFILKRFSLISFSSDTFVPINWSNVA